jgi:hypothetical protein
MGELYQYGAGVSVDLSKARELFVSSAAQGNARATRALDILTNTIPDGLITVAASSQYSPDQAVRHLVDGSGIQFGLHDNNGSAQTMWHTVSNPAPLPPDSGLDPSPAWVRFDFAQPENLRAIMIWNHNQSGLTDRGFRRTRIYGSSDGTTWFPLTSSETIELPRAGGNPSLPPVTIPLAVTKASIKSVIIAACAADGNFGSDCYGLSAVHFLAHTPPSNE